MIKSRKRSLLSNFMLWALLLSILLSNIFVIKALASTYTNFDADGNLMISATYEGWIENGVPENISSTEQEQFEAYKQAKEFEEVYSSNANVVSEWDADKQSAYSAYTAAKKAATSKSSSGSGSDPNDDYDYDSSLNIAPFDIFNPQSLKDIEGADPKESLMKVLSNEEGVGLLQVAYLVGVLIMVFGIGKTALSFKDDNPGEKVQSISIVLAGLLLITLGTVINSIWVH